MPQRDPDETILVVFKQHSEPNEAKSKLAGRLICDDVDLCEMHYPGRRDWSGHPANSFSHWVTDPLTGEQRPITYAERFPKQYRQYKEKSVQTKSGTPLDYALWLTEGRRAELRALNVYTIEMLAAVDGQDLKNLGPNGRDAKNKAIEYLEESKRGAVSRAVQVELEAAKARNAILEEDIKILKSRVAQTAGEEAPADSPFGEMTEAQLKDYITVNSGQRPQGNPSRKTLLRMAEQCTATSSAA